ncbi:hypothetical protein EI555_004187 [Monodon monoceros]|uniref:MHD domain-containing protein n=2 Tax=Monodon monoceros TaxID=40151 RepID=A0A4U1FGQ9_MONMO|nr:hypothetical protein EI555_004187 [Monodon monoceros]
MGAQDTLPVAAAFTETVNAYFKGADPSKAERSLAMTMHQQQLKAPHTEYAFEPCIVKITGEMVLSFPAGITRHFANNPSPAALTFRVTNFSSDNTQNDANTKEFWVNMPNLMIHLKKVSEQKPQATYYNVDMLKYQVSAQGIQSTPLNLAVNWRCEPASTDLRIDYKYNTDAMTTAVALNNVQFLVPIDGGFTSEGSTLSGCDIELVGAGYRFSLIKKRFAAAEEPVVREATRRVASASPALPQVMMMSDIAKDRTAHLLKKRGSVSSLSSHEFRRKEPRGRTKDSLSTVSYMDEPSQHEDASHLAVQMENTYQLGPTKHFPVVIVNHILKDVLTNYLQEEKYEPELCRQMTKTISEVIKAQVKDLMIPRYKLIVMVHIGQLTGQSILIGSRCLWDPKNDTFASYIFRNSSLFALANVYTVYFE